MYTTLNEALVKLKLNQTKFPPNLDDVVNKLKTIENRKFTF